MTEYEVIHEIPNSCSNNQMRDVFIDEVECVSPVEYVKTQFPKGHVEINEDVQTDGNIIIYAESRGLIHKFIFTKI